MSTQSLSNSVRGGRLLPATQRTLAALLLVGVMLVLVGCGASEPADASSATDSPATVTNSSAAERVGRFTGTVGAQRYEVTVTCDDLAAEYFSFRSDRTDVQDTNGDGYILSGDQVGETLVLTVVDGKTTWSTPNLQTWDKQLERSRVTGTGRLYEDGGEGRTREVSFTVECEAS